MLAIRLRRTGSKKRPFFRVVVTDSRTARDSSFVEVLGHYNPRSNPETLKLNRERLDHWLKAGAVASDTVRTLVDRMPETPETAVEKQQGAMPPKPEVLETAPTRQPAVDPHYHHHHGCPYPGPCPYPSRPR